MSYVMSHFWPDGTEEQYQATRAAVHPAGDLPAGQTFHAAGPSDGGYLVVAVWESKQHADEFVANELMAKLPPDGFSGRPDERTAEASNIQTA